MNQNAGIANIDVGKHPGEDARRRRYDNGPAQYIEGFIQSRPENGIQYLRFTVWRRPACSGKECLSRRF